MMLFLRRTLAVNDGHNVRLVDDYSLSGSRRGGKNEVMRQNVRQEHVPTAIRKDTRGINEEEEEEDCSNNHHRRYPYSDNTASTHLAKIYGSSDYASHEISNFQNNNGALFWEDKRHRQQDLLLGEKEQDKERLIVVATIDGTFYGISRDDGKIIWKSSSSSSFSSKDDLIKDVVDSEEGIDEMKSVGDEIGHTRRTNRKSNHSASSSHRTNPTGKDSSSNKKAIFRPLLSTTTTRGNNKTWRTAAVPSIDGRVYLTLGNGIKDTVTNNIKELVDRSPFMDARGRFFVAHKRSFAVALSKLTGEVLRMVQPEKDGKNFHLEEEDYQQNGKGRSSDGGGSGGGGGGDQRKDVVWIGRIDYEVTVHDARTGEVDVRFSTSEILSVEDMVQVKARLGENTVNYHSSTVVDNMNDSFDVDATVAPPINADIANKHKIGNAMTSWRTLPGTRNDEDTLGLKNFGGIWPSLSQPADLDPPEMPSPESNIISTPGGRLAMKDPETGEVDWIANEIFDSPIVYAFESSSGASLGVHIVPDAPMPHLFSQEYVKNEIERQLNSEEDQHRNFGLDSERDDTVFGSFRNGELFALPLGKRSFSHSYSRNGLPHVPLLSSTIASSAKNLQAKLPPVMSHGDWQYGGFDNDYSNRKNTGATKLGMDKSVARIISPQQPHTCDQSSKYYPECLVEQFGNAVEKFMSAEHLEHLNSLQMYSKFSKKGRHSAKDRYNMFIGVITSWIPPAVALAFVVSFEMGRRERARFEAAKNRRSTEEKELQTSSESLTVRRDLSDDYLSSHNDQQGIISVTDEILGYGGHGTVVYKGKLDGRSVAVKRMLKAYHASADREISLLIESDGHPNVVRYFLKEIRGDFVYLALELCDMNLQDLIVSLSKYNMKQSIVRPQNQRVIVPTFGVDHALRKILFDIASGVKHIHSLRIVHRDLKPANILLAKKTNRVMKTTSNTDDETVYQFFMAEMYIPKISDMGLGKQLCGQSSFGMSTFNNSLGVAPPGNQGSTIAGAGPGSVGWQAPEVMAQRLSPESASMDGSSGPEAFMEASPVDVTVTGRTSRSVDIFSLGCIFYCTLLPGSHPFGEWYEREANIMKNRPAIDALKEYSVEAWDLVRAMINRNPKARPTAAQICNHPFFWDASRRLSFICDFSDRLESDFESNSAAYDFERLLVEKQAPDVIGISWASKIDSCLLNNVQKFRTYDTSSVRDFLRLIRNKHHHFDELPSEFKQTVSTQKALLEYFEARFPKLLLHCYLICREILKHGDQLSVKYDIPCQSSNADSSSVGMSTFTYVIESDMDRKEVSSSSTLIPVAVVEENPRDHDLSPSLANECELSGVRTSLDRVANPEITQRCPLTLTESKRHSFVEDIIIWQGSTTASQLNCRGWIRSEEEWICRTNEKIKKRNPHLLKCAEDGKYRTRLCNHWDTSQGTYCPMLKKNKCVFAHGPAELRVKEGKRNRWGKLVDANGNNSNPQHSGGEDTYGAAQTIEQSRKVEGKWTVDNTNGTPKKKTRGKKNANTSTSRN